MRYTVILAVAPLSLALAACGGGADDSDADDATEETVVADEVVDVDAPVEDATEATEDETTEAEEAGEPEEEEEAAAPPAPAAVATPAPAQAAAAPVAAPPQFAICKACHSVEAGKNGIGPSLAGVFNAKAGHVTSFKYSDAMKDSGLTWDEATLNSYLEDPHKVVPGTLMSFAGNKNAAQRKAIIDYLKTL